MVRLDDTFEHPGGEHSTKAGYSSDTGEDKDEIALGRFRIDV